MNKDRQISVNAVSVLCGGFSFLSVIDPDGILAPFWVKEIVHGVLSGNMKWKAVLVSARGAVITLFGNLSGDSVTLRAVSLPVKGGSFELVDISSFSGLSAAVKKVSGIRQRIESLCFGLTPKRRVSGPIPWSGRLFSVESSGVFSLLDCGSADSGYRGRFNLVSVSYSYSEQFVPNAAELHYISSVQNGRIIASARVDSLGFHDGSVTLDKSLGLERHVSCDCWVNVAGRKIGSLPVAFDLAGMIGTMYVVQKKNKYSKKPPRVEKT